MTPDTYTLTPHSEDAEKGVLSSMLQAPDVCIDEARLKLRPEMFYLGRHRTGYIAMCEMQERELPVDMVTLINWLQDREDQGISLLQSVGGRAEVAEWFSFAPSAAYLDYYAGMVREKYILRQAIAVCRETLRAAHGDVENVGEFLDTFERGAFAVRDGAAQTAEPLSMRELTLQAVTEQQAAFEAHKKGEKAFGIASGIRGIDEMTGGLQRGELTVIAARPSMGKTSLAMNMIEAISLDNKLASGVISAEMSALSITHRLICARAKVDMKRYRMGDFGEREMHRLHRVAPQVADAPIYIDDAASPTMAHIAARARRWKRRHDIQVLAIDYLGLIRPDRRAERHDIGISELTAACKGLAKELDIPVVLLCQLNRAGADTRPKLQHLRDSGGIEQDADVVIFLAEDEDAPEGEDEAYASRLAIVAKQRNGPTGDVPLRFTKAYMRFETA